MIFFQDRIVESASCQIVQKKRIPISIISEMMKKELKMRRTTGVNTGSSAVVISINSRTLITAGTKQITMIKMLIIFAVDNFELLRYIPITP